MNYHLENAKRYLIYMYHLIKGGDSLSRLLNQYDKLNEDETRKSSFSLQTMSKEV